MEPSIWIEPDPPIAGQNLRVGYTGELPVTLEIKLVPAGDPEEVTITSAPPGWAEFTVPAGASSILIHDPTEAAKDLARVVT